MRRYRGNRIRSSRCVPGACDTHFIRLELGSLPLRRCRGCLVHHCARLPRAAVMRELCRHGLPCICHRRKRRSGRGLMCSFFHSTAHEAIQSLPSARRAGHARSGSGLADALRAAAAVHTSTVTRQVSCRSQHGSDSAQAAPNSLMLQDSPRKPRPRREPQEPAAP